MSIQTKTMTVKSDTSLAETTTTIRDTVTFDVSNMPNGITYKGLKAVLSFAEPIQWNKASTYDALTVVWDDASHGSYASKRPVPANIELTNEFYWLRTADLDAQVEMYRQEVREMDGRVTENAQAIAAETARATAAENILQNNNNSLSNKINDLSTLFAQKVEWVTPEMYGAIGDGVTDDSSAFIEMFSRVSQFSVILLNRKKYLVNTPLVLNTNYVSITSIEKSEYTPTIYTTNNQPQPVLTINSSGVSISNIAFSTNSETAGDSNKFVGVEFNAIDIDAEITNCSFSNFKNGIVINNGKNVLIDRCIFSGSTDDSIVINDSNESERRGFRIINSRFHGVQCGINSKLSANINNSIEISNNYCDRSAYLYIGTPFGVVITDNVYDNNAMFSAGQFALIVGSVSTSNEKNFTMTIANNTIIGGSQSNSLQNARNGIYINANNIYGNVNIINNVFKNLQGYGIFAQVGLKNINILSNVFDSCAYNPSYPYFIQCQATVTGVANGNVSNTNNVLFGSEYTQGTNFWNIDA